MLKKEFFKLSTWIGILGVIVGLISFIPLLKGELTVEVQDHRQLVDADPTNLLEISLRGTKLDVEKYAVSVVFLKLFNSGLKSIPSESFPDEWGIEFPTSVYLRIVDANIIDSSTPDFKKDLTKTRVDDNHIYLPKTNFNRGDWIAVRVLIIKNQGASDITPRILGNIFDTTTLSTSLNKNNVSVFRSAFGGSLFIQIFRLIGYSLTVMVMATPILIFFFINATQGGKADQRIRDNALAKMITAARLMYPKYIAVFDKINSGNSPARHYDSGRKILDDILKLRDAPVGQNHWLVNLLAGQKEFNLVFLENENKLYLQSEFARSIELLKKHLYSKDTAYDPESRIHF